MITVLEILDYRIYLKYYQILKLDIANNNIGDVMMPYLSKVLPETQITKLDITSNNIGDEFMR